MTYLDKMANKMMEQKEWKELPLDATTTDVIINDWLSVHTKDKDILEIIDKRTKENLGEYQVIVDDKGFFRLGYSANYFYAIYHSPYEIIWKILNNDLNYNTKLIRED